MRGQAEGSCRVGSRGGGGGEESWRVGLLDGTVGIWKGRGGELEGSGGELDGTMGAELKGR